MMFLCSIRWFSGANNGSALYRSVRIYFYLLCVLLCEVLFSEWGTIQHALPPVEAAINLCLLVRIIDKDLLVVNGNYFLVVVDTPLNVNHIRSFCKNILLNWSLPVDLPLFPPKKFMLEFICPLFHSLLVCVWGKLDGLALWPFMDSS